MGRLVAIGFAALLSVGVSSASAASTAQVQGTTVVVTGDDGVNNISIDGGNPFSNYSSRIDDPAGITPGAGCVANNSTSVLCGDGSTVNSMQITLGGGNDVLDTQDAVFEVITTLTVDAGAGDDIIKLGYTSTGKNNNLHETIDGGDGNDQIAAGGDSGTVSGGPGDDTLQGTSGNDTMHGDDGNDNVNGLGGDDTLFGDAGNDTVNGESGNDTIDGGSGTDSLTGDGNAYSGGNDTINAQDGEADSVACGFGADIANVDKVDTVESTDQCETVNVASGGTGTGTGTGTGSGTGTGTGSGLSGVSVTRPASLKLAALLGSGVPVTITTGEPIAVACVLVLDKATAKRLGVGHKQTTIGKLVTTVSSSKSVKVKVLARYRSKLKRAHNFTLNLAIVAQDQSGEQGSEVKKVKIRR